MYVCVCNAVTDSDIRAAVDGGARNLRQLQAETGCGTGCGRCTDAARQELDDVLAEQASFLRIDSLPALA